MKNHRWKFSLAGAGIVAVAVFIHYNDCYSATLESGNESWLHTESRFYEKILGKTAPNVRDHVGFVGEAATDVAVLTKNDPLLRGVTVERFREGCRTTLERNAQISELRDCEPYASAGVDWTCMEWRVKHENADGVQRSYITKRGKSKIVVLFTAVPAERFEYFGAPTGWLDRMEWHGPSIAFSY